jgi:putative transcriptional regulator
VKYKLRIKIIRKQMGISQQSLAKKINISSNYLSELENNKFDIRFGLLLEISKVLKVDIKDLYEE